MILEKNYKGYKIKLITKENAIEKYNYKDLVLRIEKNEIYKEWKCKYNSTFWIKIQKTQIQFCDVLDFFDKINNPNEMYISTMFTNKLIEQF